MKVANVAAGNGKPDWSRLRDWLKRQRPDIVALQKIWRKEDFPTTEFCDIGYTSKLLGKRNRSDLGVAILSCNSLPSPEMVPVPDQDVESRFLTVKIGELWVSSVYAPFSPVSPMNEHRVAWLNRLRNHVSTGDYLHHESLLCGDFNVMADGPPWKSGYSEFEWRALDELLRLGFCDLYRKAHPGVTENPGWTRGYSEEDCTKGSNRLHLILASKSLASRLQSACVAVESKPWPRRDAPPLVVDLGDIGCGNR